MLKRSINSIFIDSFFPAHEHSYTLCSQYHSAYDSGVIYLGVTDVSPMYRSVLCDKISHPGHLLTLHACDLIVGQHVSVKKFVRVFVGSEIIPVSSCASAYRASGQVANVLI